MVFFCYCLSFFAHLFLLGNGNYKEITKTNHRGRLHHGVQSARWWKLFLPRGRTSTRIQGWHVKIAHFEFKGPLNAFVNLAIFLSLWRLYLWINLKFQEKRPSLLSELAAVNGARYFRGAKTPRIKLMRLSFFFFFFETKVEHSLKAVASLPDVLFVTQSFLPFLGEERGIAWRVRRGSRRALLALRARALSGSPFFRYFKDDTSILFYFILFLSFFFFNLFIFCSQLAARIISARVFPTLLFRFTD